MPTFNILSNTSKIIVTITRKLHHNSVNKLLYQPHQKCFSLAWICRSSFQHWHKSVHISNTSANGTHQWILL